MLIRKQIYSNEVPMIKTHDSGMEMRPIYKNETQPTSPVNKLINTAAAGASMVRDVETLLTPIQELPHRDEEQNYTREQQIQASKERTERNLWRNDEVMEMLYTMQNVKALEKLNDKSFKSENVFKDVEVIMHKNGYVKKSHVQIWTKWKFLKSTYMTSRRNGVMPRIVPPQIYEILHQMINGNNQGMSDCGNSPIGSIDGDSVGGGGGGMVISGVEGGISDQVTGDDDDSYGMAHPIFGFRLGLVKSEPTDTGYDAMENTGSDMDPLEEQALLSKSERQVKEEKLIAEAKAKKTLPKPMEVPHRGRGRPPKNPPAATSTPNSTSASPAPRSGPQMPPLRVAPFANTVHSANALAVNRPPPPLTMPPTPRIRIANFTGMTNGDTVKFIQRKILPKPLPQPSSSSPVQTMHIPKEINIQMRRSSSPSSSYPKMKQIPMRKTPYSLRPDRAIPDLEASLSPPPPPIEKYTSKKVEEVPSTKHLIMQSNGNSFQNNASRKRRPDWQAPLPSKQAKYKNIQEDEHLKSEREEDDGKHYSKVLQNVIIDLSSSLRKMQTQMMRDFFNKQNELLQKEHEFQLQQDRMIMTAFQEQTQEIMLSVKQLVGTISNKPNEPNLKRQNLRKQAKTNGNCRIRPKQNHPSDRREQVELDHMQGNLEDQEEDEEMEQEQNDYYNDGEEHQIQTEDQEDNDQEENENDQEEDENDQPEDQQDDEEADEPADDTDGDDDENESDDPQQDTED